MKQLLSNYTKYNHWANDRVCNILKNADHTILDMETKSSFSTIRKTMYHIWDAETIWYKRLNGDSLTYWPSTKFSGTFDEFTWQFLADSLLLNSFVNQKTYMELLGIIEYNSTRGEKFRNMIASLIQHCINHSTFHRGQVYTMLRTNGVTGLKSIDYITYIRENIIEQ
jgi:uncharacterized damage-inducible protein DinB